MSDSDTSSPTTITTAVIAEDLLGNSTTDEKHTDTDIVLPRTNDHSRIPRPINGSRRSYIPSAGETNDGYDHEAIIRAEEVRERFRRGVRRVIYVLRMMKEMPGETWRKSLGETW